MANLFGDDEEIARDQSTVERLAGRINREPAVTTLFDNDSRPDYDAGAGETVAETARRSGLAFSAGVAFFGSVVFMMVIGWFADLLFGSTPWGIVGGIVLGSMIGFIQLFRLSSQIFRK